VDATGVGKDEGTEVAGGEAAAVTGPCSLQVQSVLFGNDVRDLDRSLDALSRAIEVGLERGVLNRVRVAYGDCSPTETLSDEQVKERSSLLEAAGAEGLRHVHFAENLGSAEGNNRLWADLDTDLVLILNPDTVVAPDTLVELIEPLRQPGVGLVEGRQLPIEHPKDYDPVTGDTSWASGACSMVPVSVVREIGGYDSRSFFLYCDDVDFSWRVRLAGYRVVHQPSARVFHDKRLGADGTWSVGAAEEYWSAEGALVLAHKYSRPARVKAIRRDLTVHGSEAQRRAVADFDRRAAEGRLPQPIDGDHRVGQFVDGNYAPHRY
jgi:GT2 family glycosyltransferase